MSQFLSSKLKELKEYTPGEQPQNIDDFIKLNTNESPYPPSKNIKKIINDEELERLRLYPDPDCNSLIDSISNEYGVSKEKVFVGNGSDEILALAFLGFCENGVAYPKLSYGFYSVFADLFQIDKSEIPLKDRYYIDIDDYLDTKEMVVIANPNAPTGLQLSKEEIVKLLNSNKDRLVIIDEAYIDFGGESSIDLVSKYNNLLVVCTFSKSRNLAGARVGFAIGDTKIIQDLNKLKYSFNPYNINRLSIKIAKEAMEDKEYFNSCIDKIKENRKYATSELRKLGFKINDSVANFIFVKCPKRFSGEEYYNYLKKNNILVRYFKNTGFDDHIRISIGTKKQMEMLIDKTKELGELL